MLAGTLVLLLSSVMLHPVHETVAEVQWDQTENSLQVALRLDAQDEQWLRKRYGKANADSWQVNLLRQQYAFSVKRPKEQQLGEKQGTGLPIEWVGRQPEGAHVWWFFEVPCPDGQRPQWLYSQLLFDQSTTFLHRIIVLQDTGTPGTDSAAGEDKSQKPASVLIRSKQRLIQLPYKNK